MKGFRLRAALLFMLIITASCTDNDLCNLKKKHTKEINEYFDFTTKKKTNIDLNFASKTYQIKFSLFIISPYNQKGKRIQDIKPFYEGYTNQDGLFKGQILLPSKTDSVFIASKQIGETFCKKIELNNQPIIFHPEEEEETTTENRVKTRSSTKSIGTHLSIVTENSGMRYYSLYNKYNTKFWRKGSINPNLWTPSNTKVPHLYSRVTNNSNIGNKSTLSELLNRITIKLKEKPNKEYVNSASDNANIVLKSTVKEGKTIKKTTVDLTLLNAKTSTQDALAYYYYKTNEQMTAEKLKKITKFFVFPKTAEVFGYSMPNAKIKARLQFFGPAYNQPGIDTFPAGYTIGWLIIPSVDINYTTSLSHLNYLTYYSSYASPSQTVYSNHIANRKQKTACLALYDETSKNRIIGMEEAVWKIIYFNSEFTYDDILFSVSLSEPEMCDQHELPSIEDTSAPKPTPEIIEKETIQGTLAFEDIWPYGGDYDMNDVVIAYTTTLTYNNFDQIKAIEDTYKVVHCGAQYTDAFGCIINKIGTIDETASNYSTKEEANQFIFFEDAEKAFENQETYKLVRTFTAENYPKKSTYLRQYNPFIVSNYQKGKQKRLEVHLPKQTPSTWADLSLIGTADDAYYIFKSGEYPFAIDLFDVTHFEVVTEKKAIGSPGEYSFFNNWVESKGEQHKDWYLHK